MRLILDSLGEELVARDLIGIAGRVTDIRPAAPALFDLLRESERRQFESEGAYGSGGWLPDAPSTVAAKGHDRILRDSDDLFEALTSDSADSIAVALPDGIDMGTTLGYPELLQRGTSRMPQRRPAQLPDSARRDMVRVLQGIMLTGAPA